MTWRSTYRRSTAVWSGQAARISAEWGSPGRRQLHVGFLSGVTRRPYGLGVAGSRAAGVDDASLDDSLSGDLDVGEEDGRLPRMRAEAVLLLAAGPLSTRKLAQLAHLADGTEARTLIRELNRVYDEAGRAIRVEQVAGGYRMATRPGLAPWLRRLGHVPDPVRLSLPMMETLSVVAYRQPVSRADAEAVRGVACGDLLRQLMERDLVRITGRGEELGRPYLYGTTKRFLQLFGLTGIDALPEIDWQTIREDGFDGDSHLEDDPTVRQDIDSITHPDSSFRDSSTSPKESIVSTALASPTVLSDQEHVGMTVVASSPNHASVDPAVLDPINVIEDEEDDLYEGEVDNADEDDAEEEVDDSDFAEDWGDDEESDDDDDDLDDEESEEASGDESDEASEDESDDLDAGDDWKEVGDSSDDDDEEDEDWGDDSDDDEEDSGDAADDDEDWTE